MRGCQFSGFTWFSPRTKSLRTCTLSTRTSTAAPRPSFSNRCSPFSTTIWLTEASSCTGHSFTRGALTDSLANGVRPDAANLSDSNRNFVDFSRGTGFFPVRGAKRSTDSQRSGAGTLITQSLFNWKFSNVWVSQSRPSTIVQPKPQNDEMGARFGLPFGLMELMIATGLPKYKMLGVIVLKSTTECVVNFGRIKTLG